MCKSVSVGQSIVQYNDWTRRYVYKSVSVGQSIVQYNS